MRLLTAAEAEREQKRDAIREVIRRKRAVDSLHSFAMNIDIPTAPHTAMYPG